MVVTDSPCHSSGACGISTGFPRMSQPDWQHHGWPSHKGNGQGRANGGEVKSTALPPRWWICEWCFKGFGHSLYLIQPGIVGAWFWAVPSLVTEITELKVKMYSAAMLISHNLYQLGRFLFGEVSFAFGATGELQSEHFRLKRNHR